MKFTSTPFKGAFVISLDKHEDNRGFFARSFCQNEFRAQGLETEICQVNISYNEFKGTLRGMHYQRAPFAETKLVSCLAGSLFDVIIDLRPNSLTYKQFFSVELSSKNHLMLYVPKGFAHGYQTLEDCTMMTYQVFEFYHPENECRIRWNDPNFNINWPLPNPIMSKKDELCADWVETNG